MSPRLETFTMRLCMRTSEQCDKFLDLNKFVGRKAAGEKGLDLGEFLRPSADSATHAGNKKTRRLRRRDVVPPTTPATSAQLLDPNSNGTVTLQHLLALKALELAVPASDVLLTARSAASWFQLSGHPGGFAPAGPGTVWKRRAAEDSAERRVYEALMKDSAKAIVPHYFREVNYKSEKFIEMEDLLHEFEDPFVIDVKLGTRTFLESEVQKTTAREDLYQKMVAVDPTAPTPEENLRQAVTKLRYMQFREQQSSTSSLGFRIEAIKFRGGPPMTDLKRVKSREDVLAALSLFLGGRESVKQRLLTRVKEIRTVFEQSLFFQTHEILGSSILMIFDDRRTGAWLIDFAKTNPVPNGVRIDHRKPWVQGNYEEGFLLGLDNLISVMEETDLHNSRPVSDTLKLLPPSLTCKT